MKKLLLVISLAALFVGCKSSDVKQRTSETTDTRVSKREVQKDKKYYSKDGKQLKMIEPSSKLSKKK